VVLLLIVIAVVVVGAPHVTRSEPSAATTSLDAGVCSRAVYSRTKPSSSTLLNTLLFSVFTMYTHTM
jgi:hypothetical protein